MFYLLPSPTTHTHTHKNTQGAFEFLKAKGVPVPTPVGLQVMLHGLVPTGALHPSRTAPGTLTVVRRLWFVLQCCIHLLHRNRPAGPV